MNNLNLISQLFLPYQVRWILDNSRYKIWEKSRQIGASRTTAFEDVLDCLKNAVPAIWVTSANIGTAQEYIEYCQFFADKLNLVAQSVGKELIEGESSYSIKFKNGTKITAVSSSPKALRGKRGKVNIDEFAFHEDYVELWKSAYAMGTWGYPLRVFSTHNGMSNGFYWLLKKIKEGKLPNWSHHYTDIFIAVAEGLVDKIKGRPATDEEKQDFIEDIRRNCLTAEIFEQEYCCKVIDDNEAFIPYTLLDPCLRNDILMDLKDCTGNLYAGVDIGRKKDLTVVFVIEKLGFVYYVRQLIVMENTKFAKQKEVLSDVLKNKNIKRCCIDCTGIGLQLSEEMQDQFGKYKVEPVYFTGKLKEAIAYPVRNYIEEKTLYLPDDNRMRADFHSLKKVTTAAGNIRFDVNRNESEAHADYFWSLALALHAGSDAPGPLVNVITSRKRRESHDLFKGY